MSVNKRGRGMTAPATWMLGGWLTLTSCTPMAPPHQTPPMALPATYEAGAPAEASPMAAGLDWQQYITDPALRALIELALQHNADLRTATLRAQEVRAAYGLQRAERWPSVGVSLDAARARVPGDLNTTGQPIISSQYQVAIAESAWELDFWGRVRSLEDAALQNYLATEAGRRAAMLGLINQVAQAGLQLRELDERIALARLTLANRAESLRIFRRRVEVGATSRLELTQVELLWQQATALLAQLEQARAAQAHALTWLVGKPIDNPAGSLPLDDNALAPVDPGLPSSLLTQRPDIIATEHALKAAGANIGAARAAFFPRISLTAAAGTASAELSGLFRNDSSAWTFAPTVSLPLFTGGRLQANLDLAVVRKELAVVRYEQAVQTAFREVSDALSSRRWLAEQVNTLRATLATQHERARLAKLRYDNGAARYLEVLDAERDLLATEQQLVQARRALLASQLGLYAALGGGSTALDAPRPR